jgi:hypothetical protein
MDVPFFGGGFPLHTNSSPLTHELPPRFDLRRNAAFSVLLQATFWYLLRQALNKELGTTSVVQQWKAKVNSISNTQELRQGISQNVHKDLPTSNVILIAGILTTRLGKVDDTFNIELVKDLAQLALVPCREKDALRRHVRQLVQELLNNR